MKFFTPAWIIGVVASQYHAQDEFGNVVYGYSNVNSAKNEQRDALGNVIGSYSYRDGTGYPKHVAYSADEFGFRITNANNFPLAVAPVWPEDSTQKKKCFTVPTTSKWSFFYFYL